jgi:nucleoredoxin
MIHSACTRFTPLLKVLYNTLKDTGSEEFEILFCSLDKTEEGYKTYTENMPWFCLPFKSSLMGKLANMYAPAGQLSIPLLVILDKDGTVIVPDGVGEVSMDPEGKNFPWRPKSLAEILPEFYIDQNKTRRPMSDLNDKYLLLYYSAHWCPPCRGFTPKLSKAYTELKKHRSDFELLFVSSDRTQSAFDEYFSSMTFCALPYEERQAKADLSKRFHVKGIPTLMIFGPGPKRPLINANCRSIIEHGDYVSDFPYAPKRYGDLNLAADSINKYRCVIVFHEAGDDEEQENIQEAMKLACENCNDKSLRFFWVTSPEGLSKTIRHVVKLGPIKERPVMVLLDIPDQGAYYVSEHTEISQDSILAFIENPGEKNQVQG